MNTARCRLSFKVFAIHVMQGLHAVSRTQEERNACGDESHLAKGDLSGSLRRFFRCSSVSEVLSDERRNQESEKGLHQGSLNHK